MVLCPACNARNANHSAFCIRCGASFASASPRETMGSTDAFSIQPEQTPEGLVDRAAAQLAEGHAQAAVDDCRRAVALAPGEVQAYAVMGMAYEQLGDLEQALEAYETAVTLAPERTAERQKAALLRLRLGQQPPATSTPRRARPAGTPAWQLARDWIVERFRANPPLSAGLASGLLVFMLGAMLLVQTGRAQAARDLQAQYQEQVRLGDEALNTQRYAEATAYYSAAYQLRPDDPQLQSRWRQAYDLSQQAVNQPQPVPGQVAQYIPNTTGPNPFEPVPLRSAVPPPATLPAMGATATGGVAVPAVPVPAPTSPRPPSIETVQGPSRTGSGATSTLPGGRTRISPSVGNPIGPVPEKHEPKPAPAPVADTTPKAPRSEVTIWMSDPAPDRPAAAEQRPPQADPQSLRSQGERLAREGRRDDAIKHLQGAATAYEARGDAASSRAAATCRAQIEVLRNSQ